MKVLEKSLSLIT